MADDERLVLRFGRRRLQFERVAVAMLSGIVAHADHATAEPLLQAQSDRALPLLVGLDVAGRGAFVTVFGHAAGSDEGRFADTVRRIFWEAVDAYVAAGHCASRDLTIRSCAVPGSHAVVHAGDHIVEFRRGGATGATHAADPHALRALLWSGPRADGRDLEPADFDFLVVVDDAIAGANGFVERLAREIVAHAAAIPPPNAETVRRS